MRHFQSEADGDLVIGLDCSTTSTKAIAFNRAGKVVAYGQEPIPLYSPKPNYYEQKPVDWWRSAQKALTSITRHIDPQRIAAIAISNQRETFVPLDKDGNSLRPAIVWLDERCKDEVEAFSNRIGRSKIHRISGKPPDYAPVVYRLAWMKKHEQGLFKKTAMICDVHTYLVWRLTGAHKTSWASADPIGIFDIKKKEWSPLICNGLGIHSDQLPETYRPGTILGTLSREAAKSTGLSLNTVVVAGGGDGQAAGLGSNVLTQGRAYLNLGTAVVAGVYGTHYMTNGAFRTMCSCSDKGFYYECSLRAGTFAIDWLIKNLLKIDPLAQPDIYRQMEREANGISPGSDGLLYLPYLCGVMNPYWDMSARGAFVGFSSSHHRGHIFRAILEGIAFEQRFAVKSVESATGIRVQEFVAIGGGAASKIWLHIISDITGRDIYIPGNTEASALGAGIAAAVGTGWYKTFADAAREMTSTTKRIKPDSRNHQAYSGLFESYRKIYPRLRPLMNAD